MGLSGVLYLCPYQIKYTLIIKQAQLHVSVRLLAKYCIAESRVSGRRLLENYMTKVKSHF